MNGMICPECGKTIETLTVQACNMTFQLICPCQEAKVQAERTMNAVKGAEIIRANMLKNSGLLKKWYGKTFDNFIPQKGQRYAYEEALYFTTNYRSGKGLIMCGTAGCGKTHLAAAIANRIIGNITPVIQDSEWTGLMGRIVNTRVEHITPVRFVNTIDFLSQVRATFNSIASYGGIEQSADIIGRYKTSDVLILDDMGTENMSEWVREVMFEVINYRYGEEMPLVVTTNKTPDELKKDYGSRIYDRIREMCVFAAIDTPTQRLTAI